MLLLFMFAAIVLPEQSVGADKSGFATSKKGLTLDELLKQTSHHNAKVRKSIFLFFFSSKIWCPFLWIKCFSVLVCCVDALHGIKDLLEHNPAELQSLKYAIVDKLRERLSDDDKSVRDTFYLLFDSKIFPSCVEVLLLLFLLSSFTCLHFYLNHCVCI